MLGTNTMSLPNQSARDFCHKCTFPTVYSEVLKNTVLTKSMAPAFQCYAKIADATLYRTDAWMQKYVQKHLLSNDKKT